MQFILQLVFILILLSWLAIYALEKRNIFRAWVTPKDQRIKEFAFGFMLMAALCLMTQLFFYFTDQVSWALAKEVTINKFIYTSALDFNSVLFEELLFRGVLLYILIKYTNLRLALAISAAAFGIYHWFTFGVYGHGLGMLLVFITTGFMGYVFALAYVKTNSIILPIGLHFGWNWLNNSIFSNGPHGTVLFMRNQMSDLEGYFALVSFLLYLVIPSLVLMILKTTFVEKHIYPLQTKK